MTSSKFHNSLVTDIKEVEVVKIQKNNSNDVKNDHRIQEDTNNS